MSISIVVNTNKYNTFLVTLSNAGHFSSLEPSEINSLEDMTLCAM